MRVLFWGTSDFAVPSLRSLTGEGFEVVGVVTQPDRPTGRSRSRLTPPPVKEAAVADGIEPIFQPEKPRGEDFLAALRAVQPDISVVVAYGHLLIDEVIALPRLGTVNVHASLLPKLRGAAPIRCLARKPSSRFGRSSRRRTSARSSRPNCARRRSASARGPNS